MLISLEEHVAAVGDMGTALAVDRAARTLDGIPVSDVARWIYESQPWIVESHAMRYRGSNAGKRSRIYILRAGKELEDDLLNSAEALHGLPMDASAWEEAVRPALTGSADYIARRG